MNRPADDITVTFFLMICSLFTICYKDTFINEILKISNKIITKNTFPILHLLKS